MGGMDECPIVIERTPTKKPEAGMPALMESPPIPTSFASNAKDKIRRKTGGATAMSSKRKYMRTEQLEAMLPRSKRKRAVATTVNSEVSPFEVESGPDEDELVDMVEEDDEEEEEDDEEEEEEDEPLTRRRHYQEPAAETEKEIAEETNVISPRRDQALAKKPAAPRGTRPKAGAKAVSKPKEAPKSVLAKKASEKATIRCKAGRGHDKTTQKDNDDKSGWSEEQWAAHEERIRYFAEVDDFELEIETTR